MNRQARINRRKELTMNLAVSTAVRVTATEYCGTSFFRRRLAILSGSVSDVVLRF